MQSPKDPGQRLGRRKRARCRAYVADTVPQARPRLCQLRDRHRSFRTERLVASEQLGGVHDVHAWVLQGQIQQCGEQV